MRGRLLIAAFCIAVATGCGGGSVNTTTVPTPVPTVTPTIAPAVSSIAIATPAPGQTAAPVPVPAPSGYAQTASLPFTNVPVGATVAVTNSVGIPSTYANKIPALSRDRISAQSLRTVQDAAGFNTVLYDIVVPSATVTIGGPSSTSFTIPASAQPVNATYYLAFYDSTLANPAWNTISGPVTPSVTATGATTIQFSGTLPSYTLTANAVYAVAVFSLASGTTPPPSVPTASPSPSPSPSPTASPTPVPTAAPTTLAYLAVGSIQVLSTSALVNTIVLPHSAYYLGMDDAGNMYVLTAKTSSASAFVTKYALNSATPIATFTPTVPNSQFMVVSGAGEIAVMGTTGPTTAAPTGTATDIWDAGSTGGAPSRTFTHPANGGAYIIGGYMTHGGTLYLPYSASVGVSYDVIPAGTSTPSRTIVESVVSPSNQSTFFPNYMAVGDDGTLYVTEWTYGSATPDTWAGLYVYPPTGPETSQPISAGPQGVDFDAAGNVYVMTNNAVNGSTDTAHAILEYAPHATSLTKTITGNWLNGYPLAVAPDGTMFFSTYSPTLGTWSLAAGSSSATQLSPYFSNDAILYNGSRETTSRGRSVQSFGGAGGGGQSGSASRLR